MSDSQLLFIAGALAMVLAPLLLLLHGFLRSHAEEEADEQSRRQENIRHAQARLAALQTADADAALDDEERREQQDEIKAQLLADTQQQAAAAAPRPPALAGGIALCAAFLFAAPLLYAVYGTPQALAPAAPAASAAGLEKRASNMAEVVAALQRRVAQQPQDGEAQALLAASLLVMNRPQESVEHYRRARAVLGDRPRLLIGLLEALMAGGGTPADTEQTLAEALALAPEDAYLLWIAGNWARRQGESEKALSFFHSADMLTTDAAARQVVRAAIAELEAEAGTGTETAVDADAPAAVHLRVAVRLAPEFAGRVAADDVVFVFARAADGGAPMPLAVQQRRAAQLPLDLTLDDSMAMVAGFSLSAFDSYEVVARISKSGDAKAVSGDLFGKAPARAGEAVTVVIRQIVP